MIINIDKRIATQFFLLAAAFALLFSRTIAELVEAWLNNPNFSHGFLIPFVALYMVWHSQKTIRQTPVTPYNPGIAIIILGMLLHLVGNVGAEYFVQRFSIVVTIAGIVIFIFGFSMFKVLLVPIAYLVLMIPIPAIIWNMIAFPLQLFAAAGAEEMIQLINLPILREGNILHLANTSLEVVDACSGLRSLTSLLALGGVFAFIAPLKKISKWLLFFSAIPVAIAVNVIRLTITAMAAAWIGPEAAHGFLHDMSGLIIFGAALILMYLSYSVIGWVEKRISK